MAAITEHAVRRLAEFRSDDAPVTSCYLDVDGRHHVRTKDYQEEWRRLEKRAAHHAAATPSVAGDLDRITEFLRDGVDRSQVRGLAIFSCTAADLFEVVSLPVPVQSRIVVNPDPALSQLEEILTEFERLGVVLVDRQRTRLFVFELGELVERSEFVDDLPRQYDTRDDRPRGDDQQHVEELVLQHLRRAAQATWALYRDVGFEHLAVGAPEPSAGQLERLLHPYLRERLAPRLEVAPMAGIDEIRQAAQRASAEIERRRERSLLTQLRSEVDRGGSAVVGLDAVLEALADRRAGRVLVSHGFAQGGWHCAPCSMLATVGRVCPRCGADMDPIDDVVEEAVEQALTQGCRVDVCVDSADLDCLGCIGALLRY